MLGLKISNPCQKVQDLRVVNANQQNPDTGADQLNKDKPPTYSELFRGDSRGQKETVGEPVNLTVENLDSNLPFTSNTMTSPNTVIVANTNKAFKTRSFIRERIQSLVSPPPAYQVNSITEISE